jgi:hypothetical protein
VVRQSFDDQVHVADAVYAHADVKVNAHVNPEASLPFHTVGALVALP